MQTDDLKTLVDRVRELSGGLARCGKTILANTLAGPEELKDANSHFSPRMMLAMLDNVGNSLGEAELGKLKTALDLCEEVRPKQLEWLAAMMDEADSAVLEEMAAECKTIIIVLETQAENLERVVSEKGGGS